ncbi:MAG TPA: thiamine ABC transporter substrate-binding protein [Acidimicrobiales bacterium]|jgi:thiamine transport system substrate-binding protein|nr:thiamine ABC transporter substrate-binding protein [Acidimicrobiales bacterium]
MRHTRRHHLVRPRDRARTRRFGAIGLVLLVSLAACGDDGGGSSGSEQGTTITLVTHDSFAVSDGTLAAFEKESGITVKVLPTGDAGEMISRAILTAGKPEGDVLYGVDNTFLQRALNAKLFNAYKPPALADVSDDLQLDSSHRVTPIDVGDVCLNYSKAAFTSAAPPASLDDLTKPAYKGAFVTENPETSSPGFAFLLATIAKYGDKGWEDYWQKLRANGVDVVNGWEQAYNEAFAGGKGQRSIVTSYASSPVAEVVYSEPKVSTPPTAVITDSCFRQVEFAGVLRGTSHEKAAQKLVDFMLSPTFQNDVPLNMFVYPASSKATLPDDFVKYSVKIDKPLTLDPKTIEKNRADWTKRWTEIVLR